MKNNLSPNLIVIGASKCGTTALYNYLLRHPDIFVPVKKELHFHSHQELMKRTAGPGDRFIAAQTCSNAAQYESYYAGSEEKKVRVDVSPSYLFFPQSIDSIIQCCGDDVKIVCLVKHPVDKIISQYSHLLSAGREDLPFKKALEEEHARYAKGYGDMWLFRRSGFMSENLEIFKNKFPNMLILHQDELRDNLTNTLSTIFNFAGVNMPENFDLSPLEKNFSGVPKSLLISKIFIRPNYFNHFLRKIISPKIGGKVREWINNNNKKGKFSLPDADFKELELEYGPEIERLNKLINGTLKIKYRF